MIRRLAFILLAFVLGLGVVATDFGASLNGDSAAFAQDRKKKRDRDRPGVFERLFGPRERDKPQKAVPQRNTGPSKQRQTSRPPPSANRKKTTTPARTTPARKTATTVPKVEVVEKDPNARKILVIGDFVGAGIAEGLDNALAKEPRLVVIERTKEKSGLVRTDVYDWNKELLGILNEENPDIIVVALGVNDREELRDGEARHAVRSDPWRATVESRIDGMTDTLKVYGRPFFWVAAPPLRGEEATSDLAYINGMTEPRITKARGHFVDIWNGFINASGQFITTGPDIEGQVKALRTSDGVGFTSVGKQKLAYYVERDIRRHTGIGAGTVDLLASVTQASTIEIGPDGKKRLVGPVLSLSDPVPGAATMLAGAPEPVVFDPIAGKVVETPKPVEPETPIASEMPQYRLVVLGESLAATPGRVDDFAWPPAQRGNQVFVSPIAAEAGTAPLASADPEIAEPVTAN